MASNHYIEDSSARFPSSPGRAVEGMDPQAEHQHSTPPAHPVKTAKKRALTQAEVLTVAERKADLAHRHQGRHQELSPAAAAAFVEAAIGRLPDNPRGFRYPPSPSGEFWTGGAATAGTTREFHSPAEVDAWILRAATYVQREVEAADRPRAIVRLDDAVASDPEGELVRADARQAMGLILKHIAEADLRILSDRADEAERAAGGPAFKNARERAARAINRAGFAREEVIDLLRCA